MRSSIWIDENPAHRDIAIGGHMTNSPWTIGASSTLAEAGRVMAAHGVRHLPVLEGGKLVGLVSQRDLYLVESLPGVTADGVSVEEAMTVEPFVVDATAPVAEVVDEMAARKLGSAIVCDGSKVVGLFTTTDALRLLAFRLRGPR